MPDVAAQIESLRREIELEVDKKITKRARNALVVATRAAYNHIMDTWPKYTYFSAANNRISITGRPISRIEPRERPKSRRIGALAGKFQAVRKAELDKLNRIRAERKDRTIVIGNAVDYAPDVSFETGKGISIYNNAWGVAVARLRREKDFNV